MNGDATRDFEVGAVIGRGFSVFFRNFGSFFVLGAIVLSPILIVELFSAESLPRNGGGDTAEFDMEEQGAGLSQLLVQVLLTNLLTAAAVFLTLRELRGMRASIGEALQVGLSRILPVIGVALLYGIAVTLGFVALIVPGLILMTIYWVAIPVAVVERPGVLASMKRSADLTRGYRWKVFAILLLLGLIGVAFGMSLIFVLTPLLAAGTAPEMLVLVGFAVSVIQSGLMAVMPAVAYHDLRSVKEGADIERLASVFD